jgi:hypothetical protein
MSRAKMSTTCFPPGAEPKGKTDFERFDDVMKRLLSVSKEKINRHTVKEKLHRKKTKRRI